jgi:hypothetical protein
MDSSPSMERDPLAKYGNSARSAPTRPPEPNENSRFAAFSSDVKSALPRFRSLNENSQKFQSKYGVLKPLSPHNGFK